MGKSRKKVLVGMSGGVDSSVTACILKERGYDVIGIHLRFWVDPAVFSEEDRHRFPQNKCCTLEGLTRTRQVADKLGIPFYVINFEEPFRRDVVDYFIEGYGKGVTPNPCIECNRKIKFGLFLQKMKELGADYVATGHYARICKKGRRGAEKYELHAARDKAKDQSYFLYTLTQEKLKHILFPIGEFAKTEVREMASRYGIGEMNYQKESQNLCFFPESRHGPFLQRYLKKQAFKPGPILTAEGLRIGTHAGLPNYTIGQRKGLGIGGIKGMENEEGNPWYVIGIDVAHSALIVGRNEELFAAELNARDLSFVDGCVPDKIQQMEAKIRYRFPAQPASLQVEKKAGSKTCAQIAFQKPQRAITPGQSIVFYEGEKVLGGGIIA